MTAAETRVDRETERERITRWRAEELKRAGYPSRAAAKLATRHDVDLHLAVDLVARGCPLPVAMQILL